MMREIKYHAYLNSEERTILLHSLVELKNQLIQQGRYMMKWVGMMNNIRACVDEIVLNDIVYS